MKRICKLVKKYKLLSFAFFLSYTNILLAQNDFICLTEFEDSIRCNYSSNDWLFYRDQSLYVPDGNTAIAFHNAPIKTINVNINIIQKDDGTGNFQDTQDTRNRFKSIINWINDFYSNYSPSDKINWVNELPDYDSKIRFSIGEEGNERIYFYQNTSWWYYYDAIHAFNIYSNYMINNHPERMEAVNIFVFGNPNNFKYTSSIPPDWTDFASNTAVSTLYWESENSDFAKAGTLAHELGHVLGLLHTYLDPNNPNAPPISDPNNSDFLRDVFLTSWL